MHRTLFDSLLANVKEDQRRLATLMEAERSRSIHQEFIAAEMGDTPTRLSRLTHAREAGARAWLRHLAHGLAETWPAAPAGLTAALEGHIQGSRERLEVLEMEEGERLERLGASSDADRDARGVTLASYMRLFAEGVGEYGYDAKDRGPSFGRVISALLAEGETARRAIEESTYARWKADSAGAGAVGGPAGDVKLREAAALWSYVYLTANGVSELVDAAPPYAGGGADADAT